MKQHDIGFRELLERLLPLEELASADRRVVQTALRSGEESRIEQAGLLALRRLEEAGVLSRMEPLRNGSGPVLRFQARDALHVFTIHLPGPVETDGVRFVPRSSLPARSPAGVPQLQRLLRLDESPVAREIETTPSRDLLSAQLASTARELLGAVEARFVPRATGDAPATQPPLDAGLATRALADPGLLISCRDLSAAPSLAAAGGREGIGSLVILSVAGPDNTPVGHLEITGASPRVFDDDALGLVALLADAFSAALERSHRLERLVFVDPLTSVYNRTYFDLQLKNEIARAARERSSLGLCLVDIDDFKSFNTRFGYEAGNQVLVTVAQSLRNGVRPFDTVSRWGGEEFALLLTPPVNAADARTVSERLRGLVERQVVEAEGLDRHVHHLGVTVSVGVALFPDHGATPQELWRAANRALLEAKRPPKNRVVFFEPGRTG